MRPLENLEDFVLFVFLHMGYVDGSLHPIERDTILEKMKALFPTRQGVEQSLIEVESDYKAMTSEVAEAMIKSGLKVFADIDPVTRKDIYAGLFDIINANGRVHAEETYTLRLLKSWLAPG